MTESIESILYGVAEDVLEKLAFIFSFPEEERANMDYAAAVAASVSFSGPFEGTILMVISDETLPELAGNMLGIDEDTAPEQQHDALKELINVVCGNLLPLISGKKSVFNVNAPEIVTDDLKAFCENLATKYGKTLSSAAGAKLALDDGQCDILLFMEGELPARTEAG